MASLPQSDPIADLLKRSKIIAVVGLSCNPLRASHGVSAYMQSHGYRIIPVNPQIEECLGEKAYRSLLDASGAPIGVQQRLMRHADVSTTMNWYGNALMHSKREAHGKVVRCVLGPPSVATGQ